MPEIENALSGHCLGCRPWNHREGGSSRATRSGWRPFELLEVDGPHDIDRKRWSATPAEALILKFALLCVLEVRACNDGRDESFDEIVAGLGD